MLFSQPPDARVACLGLAFKPNLDDCRESPAVEVAAALARRFGKRIDIVEPYARGLPMEFAGTGAALIDLDTALAQCELLIVLVDHDLRSEEHTSELQSLMRISYAVFCLKKKNTYNTNTTIHNDDTTDRSRTTH